MAKKTKLDWSRVTVLSDNAIEINRQGLTDEEFTKLAIAAEGRYNTFN